MLLDLTGILLVMDIAKRLSVTSSLLRIIKLGMLLMIASITLVCLSVYAYGLVDRGDIWAIAAVLGMPLAVYLVFASAAMMLGYADSDFMDDAEGLASGARFFIRFGGLIFGLASLAFVLLCWSHFEAPRIPSIEKVEPLSYFFYLIALATVLPSVISSSFVIAVVLLGAVAWVLFWPILIYVRTVLRLPTPLLITLTAAPFVITQALVSGWDDFHRMCESVLKLL